MEIIKYVDTFDNKYLKFESIDLILIKQALRQYVGNRGNKAINRKKAETLLEEIANCSRRRLDRKGVFCLDEEDVKGFFSFKELYEKYSEGEINEKEFANCVGVSKETLSKLIEEYAR